MHQRNMSATANHGAVPNAHKRTSSHEEPEHETSSKNENGLILPQQQSNSSLSTPTAASPSNAQNTLSSSSFSQSSSSSSSSNPNFGTNMEIAAILALNLFSVVGIVAVNKKIFQTPGFQFPSSLMSLHFLVTYLFVVAFHKFGYFTAKKIETKEYVKLGAAQVGSVALVNLSLVYNDVGTYQLMKFLVIFVTCILEYLFYKKIYSLQVYSVLACLIISISLATITSLSPSVTGFMFGLGGALGTSYYQILNKYIQNEHQVSPLQLLHYEQPFSAAWCFLFALCTEPVSNMLTMDWSSELVKLIILSAICAFGVNVSVYLIIGKTGPITYSVLGHIKTISIFGIGIFFLGDKFTNSQALWMSIAFVMIVMYGHVSSGAPAVAAPKKETSNSAVQVASVEKNDDDRENMPLMNASNDK